MLDFDDSNAISIEEFCEEMIKLSSQSTSVEHMRLMKQLYIIRNDVIEQHASASKMMQILYSLCEVITEARRASLFGQQPPSATLSPGAGDVSASLLPSRENTIEKRMSGVEDRLATVEMTVSGMNQTMSEMNQSMAQMNLSIRQMVAAGTLNSFSGHNFVK